jgi:pyruvate dehydrogenase E1 component alpha subunit
MSDPGTTYRTRDEVQKMRSTQDPIRGLQKYIEDWGLATQDELKAIDKDAKAEVEKAVEEAKASPEPDSNDFWSDIYYKGTEPSFMRGREKEEVSHPSPHFSESLLTTDSAGSLLLDLISYRSVFTCLD